MTFAKTCRRGLILSIGKGRKAPYLADSVESLSYAFFATIGDYNFGPTDDVGVGAGGYVLGNRHFGAIAFS